MPQFSVNPQPVDPYRNFKFRLKWNGKQVAGMSKLTVGLKQTTEVVKYREGDDPSTSRKSPGRTKYGAVTLEGGVTHDAEFGNWADKVRDFGAGLGAEASPKNFRKDIILEFLNISRRVRTLPPKQLGQKLNRLRSKTAMVFRNHSFRLGRRKI